MTYIYMYVNYFQCFHSGSVCYMECSALTGDGMEAIREKILQVLDGSGLGQSSNKKKFRWPWKR